MRRAVCEENGVVEGEEGGERHMQGIGIVVIGGSRDRGTGVSDTNIAKKLEAWVLSKFIKLVLAVLWER